MKKFRLIKDIFYLIGYILYYTKIYKIIIYINRKRYKILLYHNVEDNENGFVKGLNINTKPSVFARQMSYISKHYNVVELSSIVNRVEQKKNGYKNIAITFDDGYYSVKKNALPVLKQYEFPFTVFLIERCIKEDYIIWRNKLCNLFNTDKEYIKSKLLEEINNKKLEEIDVDFFDDEETFLKNTAILPLFLTMEDIENIVDLHRHNERKLDHRLYLNLQDLNYIAMNKGSFGNHSKSHYEFNYIRYSDIQKQISWGIELQNKIKNLNLDYLALPRGKAPDKDVNEIELYKNEGIKAVFYANGRDISNKQSLISLGRLHLLSEEYYKIFTELEIFPLARKIAATLKSLRKIIRNENV